MAVFSFVSEPLLAAEPNFRNLRIGITGPPGAGKSTLVNCLITEFLKLDKKVGVIAVDPTSIPSPTFNSDVVSTQTLSASGIFSILTIFAVDNSI